MKAEGRGVSLYNAGETTIPGWACVKVTGVKTVTGVSALAKQVIKPDTTWGLEYLLNGPRPIAAGEYGNATDGEFPDWGQYTGTAPTFGQTWGPAANSYKLQANFEGFTAFDNAQNTGPGGVSGIDVAIFQPYLVKFLWIKLNATLAAGGSLATQPIYLGKPTGGGGPETTSGLYLPAVYAQPGASSSIASGTFVLAEKIDGYWYAPSVSSGCPAGYINVSGTTIPAYAIMRCVGSTVISGQTYLKMDQADGDNPYGICPQYYLNGPQDVPAAGYGYENSFGTYQNCDKGWALYNVSAGSPGAFGERWGPPSGEWYGLKSYPGFKYLGSTQSVTVTPAVGSPYSASIMLVKPDPKCCPTLFKNVGDSTVPPYGVVVPSTSSLLAGGHSVQEMEQVGGTGSVFRPLVFLNGEFPVAGDQFGNYQDCGRQWAQYDTSDGFGDPVADESWGPKPGSGDYLLYRNFPGFRAIGGSAGFCTATLPDSSTVSLALVRPEKVLEVWVKLDSTLNFEDIANGHVYIENSPSDPTLGLNTGWVVEDVTDSTLQSGGSVTGSTLLLVRLVGSRWRPITMKGCPS